MDDTCAEPYSCLSKREKEVLSLVSDGLSSPDIAEELGITLSTANTYRARISDKLGIYGTASLTRFAICSQCTISSESVALKERIRQLESNQKN